MAEKRKDYIEKIVKDGHINLGSDAPKRLDKRIVVKGYVYILRSVKNNRFYIGSTTNTERRIKEHELGYVKATKNIRPLKTELCQEYKNFGLARQSERKLKELKRKDYLEKIIRDGHINLGR